MTFLIISGNGIVCEITALVTNLNNVKKHTYVLTKIKIEKFEKTAASHMSDICLSRLYISYGKK